MRFANHLKEEKFKVSPLLKSIIGKERYGASKEDVEGIVGSIERVRFSSDTKASLSMSTGGREKGKYYLSLTNKSKEYDTVQKEVEKELKKDGWKVTKSEDKGNEGFWIYFTK